MFILLQLPTYVLATNAYDKSYSSNRYGVRFGGNELYCDCNTAKFLKVIQIIISICIFSCDAFK